MKVNRVGVRGSLLPEVPHGLRHEAEHAAHPLEVGEGRQLVRQNVHQPRMKRITGRQIGRTVLMNLLSRQVSRMPAPQSTVGFGHFRSARLVDARKKAATENLHCFPL